MHGGDVLGDHDYGDEDQNKAQRPGDETDGKDGGADRKPVGDDTSDER